MSWCSTHVARRRRRRQRRRTAMLVIAAAMAGPARAQPQEGAVRVTEYGARCDDAATDDTEAFAAATHAALTRPNGAVIELPAGRCRLRARWEIVVSGNRSIVVRGAGRDVSELVWTEAAGGMRVVLDNPAPAWLRTAQSPAPVFHMAGVSLVDAADGIGGTALAVTSTIPPGGTASGLAPRVNLHDIGMHGTANGPQGWHDGLSYTNMPSGLTWDDGYIVLANVAPPFRLVGHGIHLAGGPPGPGGAVALISALYFLTDITIQNADHGVDIGPGVQDVDMERVGGNANWFVYARQDGRAGGTGSIRMSNSNPTGYDGAIRLENVDYVWLTNNQPQPFQYGHPFADWTGIEAVNSGMLYIAGNAIIGLADHAPGRWRGIAAGIPNDPVGAFNEIIVTGNQVSLMDIGVDVAPGTRNTLLIGNAINNSLSVPYVLPPDTYATWNMIDGRLEAIRTKPEPAENAASVLRPGGSTLADAPVAVQAFNDLRAVGPGARPGLRLRGDAGFEQTMWNETGRPILIYPPTPAASLAGRPPGQGTELPPGARMRAVCVSATVCLQSGN